MNPSDMYHLMGIKAQECTSAKYSGSEAVMYVKTKKSEFYCAKCGSRHVIRSGVVERVPKRAGGRQVRVGGDEGAAIGEQGMRQRLAGIHTLRQDRAQLHRAHGHVCGGSEQGDDAEGRVHR